MDTKKDKEPVEPLSQDFKTKLRAFFKREKSAARILSDKADELLRPSGMDYILVVIDPKTGKVRTTVNATIKEIACVIDSIVSKHPEVTRLLLRKFTGKISGLGTVLDRLDDIVNKIGDKETE